MSVRTLTQRVACNNRHSAFDYFEIRPLRAACDDIISYTIFGHYRHRERAPTLEGVVAIGGSPTLEAAKQWLLDVNGPVVEQPKADAHRDELLEKARSLYAPEIGDCSVAIDDDAALSESDSGAWVAGWLYVDMGWDTDEGDTVMKWNETQAVMEGWSIFDFGEGLEIERIDCPSDIDWAPPGASTRPVFADDNEAVQFVIRRAMEGSQYHIDALAIHCRGEFERPDNPFKDAASFLLALRLNRRGAIQQFFQRKVEEWMDGPARAADVIGERLTQWAVDGVNLGDNNVILGLAESMLEESKGQCGEYAPS